MEDEFVKGTRERADEAISEQNSALSCPGRRIGCSELEEITRMYLETHVRCL